MEKLINATQLLVNDLKSFNIGKNGSRYYCYTPENAAKVLKMLDMFSDINSNYIEISWYHKEAVALRIFPKPWESRYSAEGLFKFLQDTETVINKFKVIGTDYWLREIARKNFI